MEQTEQEIPPLESRVVWPPIDVFDLNLENFDAFMGEVQELFSVENALIDIYFPFDERTEVWEHLPYNPFLFEGIEQKYQWYRFFLLLRYEETDNRNDVEFLSLNKKPKFAFLQSKDVQKDMGGLYISHGVSEEKPYRRSGKVYVVARKPED